MEVLACIPELVIPAIDPPPVVESCPDAICPDAIVAEASVGTDCPATPPPAGAAPAAPGRRHVTPRSSPIPRSSTIPFPTASVVALVAIAAICWAAAWRNERLRWDALQQKRSERLALELPPTAPAGRSITP